MARADNDVITAYDKVTFAGGTGFDMLTRFAANNVFFVLPFEDVELIN